MLFRKAQWAGLADGSITVAFRYQKKPTVKAGGTLQSKGGLLARLGRLDKAAGEPWTHSYLRLIADNPGVVSTKLAPQVGMERPPFKLNVRKLTSSGLNRSGSRHERLP